MQYLLNKEEFEEYIQLKKLYAQTPVMTYAKQKVYDCYKSNPWITYEEASAILWNQTSVIHKHIVWLEKMWYVKRNENGKVMIVNYQL